MFVTKEQELEYFRREKLEHYMELVKTPKKSVTADEVALWKSKKKELEKIKRRIEKEYTNRLKEIQSKIDDINDKINKNRLKDGE